jgi:hypothetical protein
VKPNEKFMVRYAIGLGIATNNHAKQWHFGKAYAKPEVMEYEI